MARIDKYLPETVDEAAGHEDWQDLDERGDDAHNSVDQEGGHQYDFATLGVSQAAPEVWTEHHTWIINIVVKICNT